MGLSTDKIWADRMLCAVQAGMQKRQWQWQNVGGATEGRQENGKIKRDCGLKDRNHRRTGEDFDMQIHLMQPAVAGCKAPAFLTFRRGGLRHQCITDKPLVGKNGARAVQIAGGDQKVGIATTSLRGRGVKAIGEGPCL